MGIRRRREPAPAEAPAQPLTRGALRARFFPHGGINGRIVVLPEHEVVYVKVPKAASSTMVNWLSRVEAKDQDLSLRNAHLDHCLHPSDVGWGRSMELLSGAGYRFTIVRHPHRRVEAAYFDKVVSSPKTRWRRQVQRFHGLAQDEMPTFDQFLALAESQDPLEMDPHWRPQHVVLMHPLVSFDRIGRVESLAADLETIRAESGLPAMPFETRNTRRQARPRSVYDGRPDLVRRVTDLYSEDFGLYGYDPDQR